MKEDIFLLAVKKCYVGCFDIAERISRPDEKAVFTDSGHIGRFEPLEFGCGGTRQAIPFELAESRLQRLFLDGFEQVVDAVYLECPQRIFVVSSSKDYRNIRCRPFENLETQSVGETNVHNHQVDASRCELQNSLLDACSPSRQHIIGAQALHHPSDLFVSQPFVFYDNILCHFIFTYNFQNYDNFCGYTSSAA